MPGDIHHNYGNHYYISTPNPLVTTPRAVEHLSHDVKVVSRPVFAGHPHEWHPEHHEFRREFFNHPDHPWHRDFTPWKGEDGVWHHEHKIWQGEDGIWWDDEGRWRDEAGFWHFGHPVFPDHPHHSLLDRVLGHVIEHAADAVVDHVEEKEAEREEEKRG